MTSRFLSLCLFVCNGFCTLEAQDLPGHRIVVKEVGETPMNDITSMVEDARGFLWLGGVLGLYKYDGTSIDIFSNRPDDATTIVPGPYVQIHKSRKAEALWIGSRTSGLSYFDLRTERARNYTANPADSTALLDNEITGLYEDNDGGLWVGTTKFTLHYLLPGQSNPKFHRFQPVLPKSVNFNLEEAGPLGEIIPDVRDPNILWIGCRFGVYRFDKKKSSFTLFPIEKKIEFWYRPVNMQLYMDPTGALWCGGTSTGLCRLDPISGKWRIFKKYGSNTTEDLANSILDICGLDNNKILVLTMLEDAWTVNWQTQELEFLQISELQENGKPYYFPCAMVSKNGGLWMAFQLGLVYLTKQNNDWGFMHFYKFDPKINKNNWQRSYAISPDQNSLYIGTLRGNGLLVYHLHEEKIDVYPYLKPKLSTSTDVLMSALCFDPSGRCWIGSDTGLLYLHAGERAIQRYYSPDQDYKLLQDAKIATLAVQGQCLWIGTKSRGLFRLDLLTNQIERVQQAGLHTSSKINCLLADTRKRIWVGHEFGLTALEPATGKSWLFNHLAGPPKGLTSDEVTCLAIDSLGHLWASTLGGGILRLRDAAPENPHFEAYLNNGTPGGNLIYAFVLCDRGRLWMGAQSGLAVLDTATREFVNYGQRDEMFAKIGALIRLPDGRIVSAAYRGFHLFHPDSIQYSTQRPKPYLKRFRVFDKDIPLPLNIDKMESITLAYNQNHFSFELGALNFGKTERTSFAYRLEGYDHGWVYSGTRNYVSYTNLPAGHYTLRVKAANKHGVWSEQEKTLQLVINPPYWQTWWFRLFLFLVFLAIAYGFYNVWLQRQRVLRAKEAVDYFANAEYLNASVHEILWDVTNNCMSGLDLEYCVIYLLDDAGEYLVQEAAYRSKGNTLHQLKDPLRIPLGKGIVGSAALKGQPELVPDTRVDRRYIVDDMPRLSELAVPILHDGRTIGVIDTEHSTRDYFKDYHVQVLKTIASLCAEKIAHAHAEAQVKEKEHLLRELNRNLAESQLTALRAQMNPHFLFNCLNSINWYIIKNRPVEASRYIAKFSRLVRLILEHSGNRLIPLSQELEALHLYIEMEAMRFEQRFEYQIDLEPGLDPDEAMVPPLIYQPFIENAIWHGLIPKKAPGLLWIRFKQEDTHIICSIEDDGIGRAAAAANSTQQSLKREALGLKITEARIRQHNQQDNGISPVQFTDLYDAGGQAIGTRVEIRVW